MTDILLNIDDDVLSALAERAKIGGIEVEDLIRQAINAAAPGSVPVGAHSSPLADEPIVRAADILRAAFAL